MNDVLKDLDALMVKAREMVHLAGELDDRPTTVTELNASGGVEPETATFICSPLAQLGLRMADVPVTLDMARNEKRWYKQLAQELAVVLQGSGGKNGTRMMGDRGIIPLDEVWGGWYRARGVGEVACIFPCIPSRFLKIMHICSSLTLSQFLQVLPHQHIQTQ
jgi:ESCRT-II complex subunit VPS36